MTMGGSAMDTTCTPVNPSGNKGPDGSEAVDMGPVGNCLLLHGVTRATTQKIVSEMGEHSRSLKDFKDMVANLPLKMAKEAFDLNVVETAFWARLAASPDPTKAPSSTQETRPPSPSLTVPQATLAAPHRGPIPTTVSYQWRDTISRVTQGQDVVLGWREFQRMYPNAVTSMLALATENQISKEFFCKTMSTHFRNKKRRTPRAPAAVAGGGATLGGPAAGGVAIGGVATGGALAGAPMPRAAVTRAVTEAALPEQQ